MDTGLGAKAYAIIEQGKIGMILSSRPADRRQLIEEAAGHHEIQVAPPRRRAEARSRAAEPDPHRRHRLRGREAARHAEAPGGEGAALQAAARRAAPLGEGAVRAPLSRAGARASRRRGRGWPRRASARRRPRRAWRKSKPTSARLRIEQAEADSRASRDSRGRARPRARHQPPAAAAGVQSPSGRDAGRSRRPRSPSEIRDLEARREPARIALESRRAGAAPMPSARATRRRRC